MLKYKYFYTPLVHLNVVEYEFSTDEINLIIQKNTVHNLINILFNITIFRPDIVLISNVS